MNGATIHLGRHHHGIEQWKLKMKNNETILGGRG